MRREGADAEAGFTLLELMIALAVFALAALALLKMEGASIARTADLDQRLLREIVAQNMAAEILTDPAPPAIGDASGTIRNAGRQFAWTRHVAPRADFGVLSITLAVREITPGRASQAITLDFARLPAS
ncbi:MAG: type II secretion system protein GspI [Novosphingobium sp. SCN 66-18]|nr:MAG: type II secretion system protein GspI [Novosphingobium sp. SCN 66-18]